MSLPKRASRRDHRFQNYGGERGTLSQHARLTLQELGEASSITLYKTKDNNSKGIRFILFRCELHGWRVPAPAAEWRTELAEERRASDPVHVVRLV